MVTFAGVRKIKFGKKLRRKLLVDPILKKTSTSIEFITVLKFLVHKYS